MGTKIPLVRLRIAFWVVLMAITLTDTSSDEKSFDWAFEEFLRKNTYTGGAVAATKDGKLIIARGYGTDQDGNEVAASSMFHATNVAKSLTGLAIMQLVQAGKISLQDKVFGEEGILKSIQPWEGSRVDPGLYEITVDHLLRHSAGWDVKDSHQHDTLYNKLFHGKYDDVKNIAKDMGFTFPLRTQQLISYFMSHPLHFTPGTRFAYSNIAHLVLGEVVETASGTEHKTFLKKYILSPCGMWNTHLPAHEDKDKSGADDNNLSTLDAISVDAALSWNSNIYDVVRLLRCTFETGQLLNKDHLKLLLAEPDSATSQHNSWYSSGFHIDRKSNIWLDADPYADGLIVHHSLHLREDRTLGPELPDSWVVLLYGKSANHSHTRHHMKDLMALLDLRTPQESLFLHDLSDIHKHPKWELPRNYNAPTYAIKYKVNENHVTAYVDALRDEGLDIVWLTSYTMHQHTFFLVVSKHISHPIRSQMDYIFEHGMDHRQLLKRKLQLEESSYNMTMLHSYKSHSHSEPISFSAIFRQDAFSADTQMKYGTGHLPEPYQKLVQMYYEKQFYPISQTVVYLDKDEQFSFIFIKEANNDHIDFKYYSGLSAIKLAKLSAENAKNSLHLSYLNSYDISGKFKFAAFYTNATESKGLLEVGQTQDQTTETVILNLKKGLTPKYMAPYIEDDSLLKLVTYYEEQ